MLFWYYQKNIVDPIIQQIAKEYKDALKKLYGDDLAELILFGSYARGDQREESDVDFAIVLKNPDIRTFPVLEKTSSISSELSLKYGLMISTFPVSLQKKKTSMQGVYRNVRREGIIIWTIRSLKKSENNTYNVMGVSAGRRRDYFDDFLASLKDVSIRFFVRWKRDNSEQLIEDFFKICIYNKFYFIF